MAYIPRDVWLYIAQFIPDDDLRDMISVNSVFYDLGMDARYREVHICYLRQRTVKELVRLMDPAVAKRVRLFKIDPLIDRDFTNKPKYHTTDKDFNNDGNSRWKRSVDIFMKRVREPSTSKKSVDDQESARQYSCNLGGLEQALTDAVSCWSNVTEFAANWWESGPVRQLQSFLPAAWSAFGSNLQTVSLAGNLASIRVLVSTSTQLPTLRALRLEFTNNILREDDVADLATLVEVIAPFINRLGPTLEDLSISSWASIDLSEFFLNIGFFPLLRRFSIRLPFNKAFSNNPDGFTRLLRDHSPTLTTVSLRLNPSGSMIDPSTEESLSQWMAVTSSDPLILANLRSFQMYPTLLNTGFEAFMAYLGRSADTLTDLVVRDRYLTYDQVNFVVSTFSHRPAPSRLTTLRLNVRKLSLRLIDLFAATLPGLHKLSLYIGEGWREDNVGDPGDPPAENLRCGLRERMYPEWKLFDIGIWQSGAEVDGDLMMLLARSIPSLRSFWGQGNLSLHIMY